MRRIYTTGSTQEVEFGIYEVHYNHDKVVGWTKDPRGLTADDVNGLKFSHQKIAEALEKPVLDFENGREIAGD